MRERWATTFPGEAARAGCSISWACLEAGFIEALKTRATDAEVWEWVSEHMTARSAEEIEEFNDWMSSASPDTGDWTWEWFQAQLEESDNGHRSDIKRHFDRLDLDEGRDVPVGGRHVG